jgi:hypothetical protein
MKPFNLEAALAGEPVITRAGKNAKIIAYVPGALDEYRVVAFVDDADKIPSTHFEDGRVWSHAECDDDLFMKVKTKTVSVNFYYNGYACYYDTEEDADQAALCASPLGSRRIGNKAYRVEIEI